MSGRTVSKAFVVWCPEHNEIFEDGRTFGASSAADAARQWAQRYDSEDSIYEIANEYTTPTVCVLAVADGDNQSRAKKFRVTGRMTVVYDATETEETP